LAPLRLGVRHPLLACCVESHGTGPILFRPSRPQSSAVSSSAVSLLCLCVICGPLEFPVGDPTRGQSGGGPPQSRALRAVGGRQPSVSSLRNLRLEQSPCRGVSHCHFPLHQRPISGSPQVGVAAVGRERGVTAPAYRGNHGAGAEAPAPVPFVRFVVPKARGPRGLCPRLQSEPDQPSAINSRPRSSARSFKGEEYPTRKSQ
jgi:hypothetical protein